MIKEEFKILTMDEKLNELYRMLCKADASFIRVLEIGKKIDKFKWLK